MREEMNMDKKLRRTTSVAIIALICFALFATGCGGDSYDAAYTSPSNSYKAASEAAYDYYDDYDYGYATEDSYSNGGSYSSPSSGKENTDLYDNSNTDSSRKLIKRVSMSLETLEFDKSISMIEEYVRSYNGYIESSDVRYNDYYTTYRGNSVQSRSANYTIRIPNNIVDDFVSNAGNIGNVVSSTTNTEDITLGYLDVESRAKALKIQQERLLALLEEAQTVDEIISLEDRISQVTYELESKESTLRNYDSLVSYSTVNISLTEVTKITEPEPETMGQRISSGLSNTFENIGNGLQNFLVNFIVDLPYIVVFLIFSGIIALIVVLIVKLSIRGSRKRAAKRAAAQPAMANEYGNPVNGPVYNGPLNNSPINNDPVNNGPLNNPGNDQTDN